MYNVTSNRTCQFCSGICKTCFDYGINKCYSCIDSYSLVQSTYTCTQICPAGTYSENKLCLQCPVNCTVCSSAALCSKCGVGFYYLNEKCLQECGPAYFEDNIYNVSTCSKCHSMCAQCTGKNNNECQECNAGYYLDNTTSTCFDSCPVGYYKSGTLCTICHESCTSCNNTSTFCQSCSQSYFLDQLVLASGSGVTCVKACSLDQANEKGFYTNSTTHKCEPCHSSCYQCSGPMSNNCLDCVTGYYFLETKLECVLKCPDFYMGVNKICVKCDKCLTCSYNLVAGAEECLSCPSGKYLHVNKTCLEACPELYYKNT